MSPLTDHLDRLDRYLVDGYLNHVEAEGLIAALRDIDARITSWENKPPIRHKGSYLEGSDDGIDTVCREMRRILDRITGSIDE